MQLRKTNTLKTIPKPPSPILLSHEKLFVIEARVEKSNKLSSSFHFLLTSSDVAISIPNIIVENE